MNKFILTIIALTIICSAAADLKFLQENKNQNLQETTNANVMSKNHPNFNLSRETVTEECSNYLENNVDKRIKRVSDSLIRWQSWGFSFLIKIWLDNQVAFLRYKYDSHCFDGDFPFNHCMQKSTVVHVLILAIETNIERKNIGDALAQLKVLSKTERDIFESCRK
jgi:hypothetical protein